MLSSSAGVPEEAGRDVAAGRSRDKSEVPPVSWNLHPLSREKEFTMPKSHKPYPPELKQRLKESEFH
jgi:hypothetical protein